LKGEPVRWAGGEGVADGIDDSGALRVETSAGPVTLDAGEVHLLRC
jgi:biotin-(acetyl-CoA carboxylase) ligase